MKQTITNNKEYLQSLDWVDAQFQKLPNKNSDEGRELEAVLLRIKEYEDIHYKIPTSKR